MAVRVHSRVSGVLRYKLTLFLGSSQFKMFHFHLNSLLTECILGLQPRDKAAMFVVNTKETFLLNLHQNRVHFPTERNGVVLDPQHGRRDVTCKPAVVVTVTFIEIILLLFQPFA